MESTCGEDTVKIVEVTTKDLEYYVHLDDKTASDKTVNQRIDPFMKGRVSWWANVIVFLF